MVLKNRVNNAKQQAKKVAKTKICALVAVLTMTPAVYALNTNEYIIPRGWNTITQRTNMHIYQKAGEGLKEKTYVQIVDIRGGARVRLMQWKATDAHHQTNRPNQFKYWINNIDTWKNDLYRTDPYSKAPQSVVNGAFFDQGPILRSQPDPTIISFPLVSGGKLIESGSDVNRHTSTLRAMLFDSSMGSKNYPRVSSNIHNLLVDGTQNAIVGHTPSTDKRAGMRTPRTYLCAIHHSQKGALLLVYSTTNKAQDEVKTELTSWNCHESRTVMLDGGDSMQFASIGLKSISHGRRTPQAIGLFND